jgi:hemerythrin
MRGFRLPALHSNQSGWVNSNLQETPPHCALEDLKITAMTLRILPLAVGAIWFAFGNFSLVREKVIIFTGNINLPEATTELTMKWTFAYGTGDKCIDDQHKALFEMSEVFRAALDEGRGERAYELLLESLDSFAHFHFGFEERCMKRFHCPAAQQNAQAHPKFIDALSGFRQRYVVGGFDRADAQLLVDFIDQWLADHICRIDVRLKPYVQAL